MSCLFLSISHSAFFSPLLCHTKTLPIHTSFLLRASNSYNLSTMSKTAKFQPHAFAGNPIRAKTPKSSDPFSPNSALEILRTHLSSNTPLPISPNFRVLPFRQGRPLVGSGPEDTNSVPTWHLGWLSFAECRALLTDTDVGLNDETLIYMGSKSAGEEDDVVYWAIDVSEDGKLVEELARRQCCFIELRTLMVATDWTNPSAMGELAIAGHGRSLLEWRASTRFCGRCGSKTIPKEAGRRSQCSNESCKIRIYPRVDPVVIMLVIDEENDRALLSRQSRFVPRMWSCIAGFMEPGESLEEAVRRETWEETGIEVGEVVYHSSQPWPVAPNGIPCQLMVGFLAYAKSLDINVDKEELEDAQWHSREDVKKALAFTEYEKAQRTNAVKVAQMCHGVQPGQNLSLDFNKESGELAPMFIPGPFAIAHHLISTWVNQGAIPPAKQHSSSTSMSNL